MRQRSSSPRVAALGLGAVLCLGAARCASAPLPRAGGEPPPTLADAAVEARYRALLEAHTRRSAVYDGLDLRLLVQATWQGPAFAAARVERQGAFQLRGPSDVASEADRERARLGAVSEFFVALHASDARFDGLDRPDGLWRLALRVGDREVEASGVERLGRPTPALRALYPYLESFWTAYVVRFPRLDARPGEALVLKLASTLGRAELSFDVRD